MTDAAPLQDIARGSLDLVVAALHRESRNVLSLTLRAADGGPLPAFRAAHPRWQVVVSRCACAIPAGPIDERVADAWLAEVRADLAAASRDGGVDAIWLSLHGAAMTASRPALDFELVRALHDARPGVPIAATFDMHGNHPEALGPLLALGAGWAAAACAGARWRSVWPRPSGIIPTCRAR